MPKVTPSISATGQPTTTQIGIFPLKTYGSLIKRELKWFEDQANDRINSILPLYKLAKKIALADGISDDVALSIVQNLGEPENQHYAFTYLEDLSEIQRQKISESDFNSDIVTMFLQSRIPSSKLTLITQDLFDYYDIEINPDKGWQSEYTEHLPMSVIDDIVEFVLVEKDRLNPKGTTEVSDEVVTLGK